MCDMRKMTLMQQSELFARCEALAIIVVSMAPETQLFAISLHSFFTIIIETNCEKPIAAVLVFFFSSLLVAAIIRMTTTERSIQCSGTSRCLSFVVSKPRLYQRLFFAGRTCFMYSTTHTDAESGN